MTEPSGEVLKLFYSPAACTILRKVLESPERWPKYRSVTLAQVAAVAQEAGVEIFPHPNKGRATKEEAS